MQTVRLVALGFLLLSLSVVSVSGQGYVPAPSIIKVPLLGTSGAPALAGKNYGGLITVLYADGQPVLLGSNNVYLSLCSETNTTQLSTQPYTSEFNGNQSCVTIETKLQQTAPGTYRIRFQYLLSPEL